MAARCIHRGPIPTTPPRGFVIYMQIKVKIFWDRMSEYRGAGPACYAFGGGRGVRDIRVSTTMDAGQLGFMLAVLLKTGYWELASTGKVLETASLTTHPPPGAFP